MKKPEKTSSSSAPTKKVPKPFAITDAGKRGCVICDMPEVAKFVEDVLVETHKAGRPRPKGDTLINAVRDALMEFGWEEGDLPGLGAFRRHLKSDTPGGRGCSKGWKELWN